MHENRIPKLNTMIAEVPDMYRDIFDTMDEEVLASVLISYVIYDIKFETTPATWQDAEMFIRFKKRNVLNLAERQVDNARRAFILYQAKYIAEHMDKDELVEMFNRLFSPENMSSGEFTLLEMLHDRFMVGVDDLFMIQEKRIVTEKDLDDFDQLFEYPAWLEFDEKAKKRIYKDILADKMSDKQIDYFLGVSEEHEDYVDLYPVVKHVLMTTKDAHLFWTAGDVLNLIWNAAPDDEKTHKWFNDEIFEIFWPRVGGTWPILHMDALDFGDSDVASILRDAIGWINILDDITERLPELKDADYTRAGAPSIEAALEEFEERLSEVESGTDAMLEAIRDEDPAFADMLERMGMLGGRDGEGNFDGMLKAGLDSLYDMFTELCEVVQTEEQLKELKELRDRLIELIMRKEDDYESIVSGAYRSFETAEKHVKNLQRERKLIKEKLVK